MCGATGKALNFVSSMFVYCGEKTDPIENELATFVAGRTGQNSLNMSANFSERSCSSVSPCDANPAVDATCSYGVDVPAK